MYARRSNYQTRLRDLKDFFRLHQLPKELVLSTSFASSTLKRQNLINC